MRSSRGRKEKPSSIAGLRDRARELLRRLETDGHDPVRAAEELDRLQAALIRADCWEEVRVRLRDLCDAWATMPLRGDRGHAWLVLVGLLGAEDHAETAATLARDPALRTNLR